ncbi:MAG TPA: hypothetical protein VLR94_10375 [Acidobacteriota bacterium]|nr:hypothetical protein [Acidobacteriota bacterium]
MTLNQKGEGKAGAIFGFALFALVVYLGLKIIPVMIRVYAFEDAVREECKFLHGRTTDKLAEDIVAIAQQKDLPVTEDDITMSRTHEESHQNLKVVIDYTVNVVTPFFVYPWHQTIDYEAPVFE